MTSSMTDPRRFLFRMALFLVAVAAAVLLLFAPISSAFLTNPALNGLILGVLVIGIVFNFRQVFTLTPEIRWLEAFQRGQQPISGLLPRLLAPMASMLGEMAEKGHFRLSPMATRSLLDGIASRLEEARDIARYLAGLSIFLGLLGTFWGLLETVGSIGDVIRNLSVSGDDMGAVFEDLKRGLQAPMSGMGTAFSSSLFGLSGSLILGFLELQAGQAQNQFYNDLEEWLAGQTRAGGGMTSGGDGESANVPAYIEALLEQTADGLTNLHRVLEKESEHRQSAAERLNTLTHSLSTLSEQMRAEQHLLLRMGEAQLEIKPVLDRLATAATQEGFGVDKSVRNHLASIDAALTRMAGDMPQGREKLLDELRSEIKLLARTLAASVERLGR